MAYHDPLTGLPNRLLLNESAEQAIAKADRNKALVGFVSVDIDDFKSANDSGGHLFGDMLLKLVAEALREPGTA